MRKSFIALSTVGLLIATSFSTAVAAQPSQGSPQQSLSTTEDRPPASYPTVNSSDTSELQNKVLMKINEQLTRGSITADQASNLKDELNQLSESESWYKSMNQVTPASVVQQDTESLNKLLTKLCKGQTTKPVVSARDALHSDIDELVSKLLAGNKIGSNQAEVYYSRLAQIESVLESRDSQRSETAAAMQNLRELKNTLLKK